MTSRAEAPPGAVWLTRVLLVPLIVVLVAAACVVTAKALAVREAGTVVTPDRSAEHQPWTDSYSRRFPGCVPAVLWPGRETPVAVIVQWDGRTVDRVERGAPLRRALAAPGADRGRIIGACYR